MQIGYLCVAAVLLLLRGGAAGRYSYSLRRAADARSLDIVGQFLVEAVTLSMISGLPGILLGIVAAYAIAQFAGWRIVLSAEAVMLAVAFAFAIGMFFGFYPARKAGYLNPVEALRFE